MLPTTARDVLARPLAATYCGEIDDVLADHGFGEVAGVDEAGRGPLAGPCHAAAVVVPEGAQRHLEGLTDSKKLTALARERFYDVILQHCYVGLVKVSPGRIDRVGINAANHAAMRDAVKKLNVALSAVLVDGYALDRFRTSVGPVEAVQVVKGDARSRAIAAASVIAKVSRDRAMMRLAKRYPAYGFDRHKGYGTAEHLAAIAEHGPCPAHRMSFRPLSESRA